MPMRSAQRLIERDERGIQRFCQGYVRSVVGREGLPQRPDTLQKRRVRIAPQGQRLKSTEPRGGLRFSDTMMPHRAAKNLSHFQVDEVRSVQALSTDKARPHPLGSDPVEEQRHDCGSVNDDER